MAGDGNTLLSVIYSLLSCSWYLCVAKVFNLESVAAFMTDTTISRPRTRLSIDLAPMKQIFGLKLSRYAENAGRRTPPKP